jgi:trk system potassium uptake protein
MSSRFFFTSPARLALLSFSVLILVGTFLLALPVSRTDHISLFDILFTATSATCVTGLFIVPLEHFTFFGLFVIMLLMQFGALGLSTIGLSILYLLKSPAISTHVFASNVLELEDWHSIKRLLIFILQITALIELIGIIAILPFFYARYTLFEAIFYSCFHVISAFCNAGIEYKTIHNEQYLMEFAGHIPFLFVTMLLIFFGSLGFTTIQELVIAARQWFVGRTHHFSLSTKLVLHGMLVTTAFFSLSFFFLERNGAFASYSLVDALFQSLFHAVSFKSCGFATVPFTNFHVVSLLLLMISAFIGSAPGSTGSGVKIIAALLYAATVRAVIIGKESVQIYNRTVPMVQVLKSVAVVSLAFFGVLIATFLLFLFDSEKSFLNIVFLAVSAITNIGVTLFEIHQVSFLGHVVLLMAMIIGRIGALAFIASLRIRYEVKGGKFSYPEERIMLG